MTEEKKKEERESEESGRSGSHKDNELSRVQKVMKDNDIPFFYSDNDKKDGDEEE